MKQRPFFYQFGNLLFLFFILQIQFVIKGSNAIPGNSHPNSSSSSSRNIKPAQTQPTNTEQLTEADEVSDFDQATLAENVQSGNAINEFVEKSQKIVVEPMNIDMGELKATELVVPRAIPMRLAGFETINYDSSPDFAEKLGFSMMRPKSVSRQSTSANSGDQTPGYDFEWVEENSVKSGCSRIARLLKKKEKKEKKEAQLVLEEELKTITFDELCEYLEATPEVDMHEDELVIICRRIIISSETFVKALKDLPLFINTHTENKNAIKINSILFNYLAQSSEDFIGSDDDLEQGSVSSRCSRRTANSSIESTPMSSRTNTPKGSPTAIKESDLNASTRVLDEINITQSHVPDVAHVPEHGSMRVLDDEINITQSYVPHVAHVQEHGSMRVLDEINIAQSHVPHFFQPSLTQDGFFMRGHMGFVPPAAFIGSIGLRAFPSSKSSRLYTLTEEARDPKQTADNDEEDDGLKIEELD